MNRGTEVSRPAAADPNANAMSRRGPYGPAHAFLPKGQSVCWAESRESLLAVLERLVDEGYSQAPVRKNGRCVGMLELFQVFCALIERKDFRDLVARLQAGDFATPARYLHAEEWVDQNFDWLADEVAIVGSEDQVAGIITPSDVLRRVNDYTEAFSVFAELEGTCRALFDHAFPLAAEKDRLHRLFRDRSGKRDGSDVFLPQRPDELGFWHYWAVFTDEELFRRLEPFCHWSRAKFADELDRARLVRNDVMHFKRQAEPREVDRLRLLRDQLASIERGWAEARRA